MSGHGRTRTQGVLVIVEFTLALTLLGSAGMVMHSFWNLSHVNLGVNPDHLLTGSIIPRTGSSSQAQVAAPTREEIVARERPLLDKLRSDPGVEDVAFATNLPLLGSNSLTFSIVGQPSDPQHRPVADFELVTPGFLRTFGARMAQGRFLEDSDTLSTPLVAVVNESFVRRYFPNVDPLTQSVKFGMPTPGQDHLGPAVPFQVVGVFHNILNSQQLSGSATPEVLLSLWQVPLPNISFGVRTAVDPGAVTSELRSTVETTAPSLNVADVQTMQEVISGDLILFRFSVVLFGGFAAVALLLAALGIYGVMSFTVAQRTHEVGIRMALGAEKSEVVAMMIRSGLRLALPGMAAGLVGVFVVGRLLRSTLYGVGAVDYMSIVLVAALLSGVALLACWVPARRSAEVDPMIALREE